jgi:hypothetical protein
MQITHAPFGYQQVVPFLKTQKVRLLAPGQVPEFAQRGHAIPISYTEYQPVAHDYPIIFTSSDGKEFVAVAVLGLVADENLFFAGGAWAPGVYIPAYARRFPFCMSTITVNRAPQKDRLICVEKAHVDDSGEALFDAAGRPSEKWLTLERLLAEYEADLDRGREMCSILADYGLYEPFTMQARLDAFRDAQPMQMTGMYRVAEKSLENLNAAQLKNLMRKGILGRVYLHLASLINFGRLLERKGARATAKG